MGFIDGILILAIIGGLGASLGLILAAVMFGDPNDGSSLGIGKAMIIVFPLTVLLIGIGISRNADRTENPSNTAVYSVE